MKQYKLQIIKLTGLSSVRESLKLLIHDQLAVIVGLNYIIYLLYYYFIHICIVVLLYAL